MTEGLSQGDQSVSKPKAERQSGERTSSNYYPVGQWREELSIDTLKVAAEAARQSGDTKSAAELQRLIEKPELPPQSSPTINNVPTQSLPRKETHLPPTNTYPVGQWRERLSTLPSQTAPNAPKGPTPSGGK